MKSSRFLTALAILLAFAIMPRFAMGASDTWTGANGTGDFNDPLNWLGGQVPGNTSSGATATTDNATFNSTSSLPINIDAGRTVARFIFDTGVGPLTFTGNKLYVYGGNMILNSGSVANSITYMMDITGSTNNRTFAFSGVTGGAAGVPGVHHIVFGNLTAGGSGASGGTINATNLGGSVLIRGVISDPSGTARTAVVSDHYNSMVWLKGANTFTGGVGNLFRSMIIFDSVTPIGGSASSLGIAVAGNTTLSDVVATDPGGLHYVGRDPAGHATDRRINMNYGAGNGTTLGAYGVGPLTWNGEITSTMSNATQRFNNLILTGTSEQANAVGVISDSSNSTLGFPNRTYLTKLGGGTWVLTAANTYSGFNTTNGLTMDNSGTVLRAGKLVLDFAAATAPTSNILPSTVPALFYDGVLAIRGKDGTANSQTLDDIRLREGYTSIEIEPGASGGTVTVNLGALSRKSSVQTWPQATGTTHTGSVLNISNPSGATVTTAHTETTNGVLTINATSFVTANKTDWATLSGSNIVALGSYQTDTNPANWVASDNVSLGGNPDANVAANTTINTLRFTGSSTLGLDGNLTIGAGGILVTGTGAVNITGGNLIGGGNQTNRELIVVQNNTAQAVTISATLRNGTGNTHLTKAGPGTLILSGTNNGTGGYGETNLSDGVLAVASLSNLGRANIRFAGGQLGLMGDDLTLTRGTAAGNFQVVGSWGFAAYGGTRTVNLVVTSSVLSLDPTAAGGTGELLLSAPDADGKIIVASSSANAILSVGGTAGLLAGIRVFNGAADVDAEISAPLTVSGGNNTAKGGIIKVGAGVLQLSGNNTYNGPTIVAEGGLIVTGSNPNSVLHEVWSGAWLGGTGMISSLEIHPGAKLAPGTSIGTLSTQDNGNGYFLWNGEASGSEPGQLQFELSTTDNTSDRLNLGTSEFLKGTGSVFKFDFMGGGKAGEAYTLVQFGSTTFADASEFSYENLGAGLSGAFTLNSNDLVFTVIPEPGTVGMVLAGLALMALRRCRMRG